MLQESFINVFARGEITIKHINKNKNIYKQIKIRARENTGIITMNIGGHLSLLVAEIFTLFHIIYVVNTQKIVK